ncbi:hypothetical protein MJO28_016244 [Puccinia striiformis f. sp. tritici]|uniref:Uncharacterized protein n=3 Tax=Puccinia striiformis f. sp. tritici TaxID=168172 RepID=A0A0L0VZL9_9BASI|nr:hypothetical protein MJO29_016377 [Puccinia striiformis f. sp. tritici]KAI7935373.1 hypothetical protein MJO28_016244 [Puccinia striiformis f. sp. tritici]KAI9601984.1 hypothetical protein KEM48_001274 [Puccinia striiformis f. sp. tritici PST-130]KNF04729.1 hypothetical protein PSTG_02211 [Puccinia striiformis f. sp. tritici PST-78]
MMSRPNEETQQTEPKSATEMDYFFDDPDGNHPIESQPRRGCSSVPESIVKFCKFMMGASGASSRLPNPPTTKELKARKAWVAASASHAEQEAPGSNIGDIVEPKSSAIRRAVQPSPYKSARMPANHAITALYKTECDHQFQSHGFPRITFERNKSSLKKSEWNGLTADILADQWKIWFQQQMLSPDEEHPTVDARSIIGQWMKDTSERETNQYHMESPTVPEIIAAEHLIIRRKVAEIRRETALAMFPENPKLAEICRTECMSDFEESDDPNSEEPPTSIVPFWRSDIFGDFLHALDQHAIKRADPDIKEDLSTLLARKPGVRAPLSPPSAQNTTLESPE